MGAVHLDPPRQLGKHQTGSQALIVIDAAAHPNRRSTDGKGAWRDNVCVERLWRTIKYEEVYLHAYAYVGVSEARASIGRYLRFYNSRRPHSSLDGKTPDQAYFEPLMPQAAAA